MPGNINASRPTADPLFSVTQVDGSRVSVPSSFDERLTAWSARSGGLCIAAANTIRRYIADPPANRTLNLCRYQLTELPEIPDGVKILYASHNCLESIPPFAADSDNLEAMFLNNNRLSDLPEMPISLRCLSISGNPIASNMQGLSLHTQTLAEQTIMAIDSGELWSEGVFTLPEIFFRAEQQRFSELLLSRSEAAQGPVSSIETASTGVATWYSEKQHVEIFPKWEKFDRLDGSKEFGQFIERLGTTRFAKDEEARASVLKWLDRLSGSEQFSKAAFHIAWESTNSCHDSVWLTFNAMQQCQIALDVQNGDYDEKLPELIKHARIGFRRECINEIAAQKMEVVDKKEAELKAAGIRYDKTDEIEVYLGLQVQLNKRLELNSVIKEMLFYRSSNLTSDDIKCAETSIKQKENEGFAAWLGTWNPWTTVVERLAPDDHEAMQEEIIAVYSSDAFNTEYDVACIAARGGRPTGLTSGQLIQLEAAIGKETGERLTKKINVEFTKHFFEQRNMANLLEPKWPVEAPAV